MYCHNCGKWIPDGAKFCRYCGVSQAIVNASRQQLAVSAQSQRVQEIQTRPVSQPILQSQPQPVVQPQPVLQPAPQSNPQPQSISQSQSAPAATGSAFLASQKCTYRVAPESEMNKYEWGGPPEGTVDIYEDRLEFFKKSKVVKMAFGVVASALSGKGKADITVPGSLVLRDTVENKKNEFRFRLTDGRAVRILFSAISVQQDACNAMFRFLKM